MLKGVLIGLLWCLGAVCAAGVEPEWGLSGGETDTLRTEKRRPLGFLADVARRFGDIDTTYINPNYYNFIVMAQNTNTHDRYLISATSETKGEQYVSLSPTPSFKIGPYFGWRSLFLGYAFDVTRIANGTKKSEFNVNLYTALLGVDFTYKRNSGGFRFNRIGGFGDVGYRDVRRAVFDGMKVKSLGVNFYYIFNHRKFSYPAAFNQSTQQIKSAGSWKLGLQYARQNIDFDYAQLPPSMQQQNGEEVIQESLKFMSVKYYDYSVNFGYAYNWVPAKNWLVAGSLAPSVGLKLLKGESGTQFFKKENLNVDCIFRLGVVWNNSKYFAGASWIQHTYDYRRGNFSITNSFNLFNVYVGFNFDMRAEYRKKK